jgi:threonylcarbamoyladenosine tRNA methylthiotransferase MtaB
LLELSISMKIYLDSIGCRLNQSEIESFARQFRAAGHSLVPTAQEADLAVINTCTVTNAADSDSRQKIRHARRSGTEKIIVTGCWSTMDPEAALAIQGVSEVIANVDKDHLVADVLQIPSEAYELEPLSRTPVPGARARTRAFIKVQDGCDNRCTFCVTTIARGPGKSRTIKEILADIQATQWAEADETTIAKEIVLTGVHLGSWGQNFSAALHLSYLVETILKETDVPRLRLSSLEPWDLDADFFSLWEDDRLCRHLHLPLQSGSAAVLKRMARKISSKSYAALVRAARTACPDIAITTDLIAGFPGETEEEFQQTVDFIQEISFSGGHVFTYSARPATAAALMSNQVPFQLRKERNARLRAILEETERAYQLKFLNQTLPVLWESVTEIDSESWHLSGLSGNYLRVTTRAQRHLWNQITPVHLTAIREKGLLGEIPTQI